MSEALASINGEIFRAQDARVSVFDRGFLFGDGVYETGRSYERCLYAIEEHLTRLRRSASRLFIPVPWSDESILNGLSAAARAFDQDNLYFRTIVTRGVIDHVGLDAEPVGDPTLVHLIQDLPTSIPKLQKEGIRLLTSTIVRNSAAAQDPDIKTSNYLNSLLALKDVKRRGGDDGILCDAEGRVTEGTTFSIFGVTPAGVLITPSLKVGILQSITRKHVLEIAHGIARAEEGFYSLKEFQECREVFIASSLREIVPVKSWDDRTYAHVPGALTSQLQERLKESIGEYVKTHPKF